MPTDDAALLRAMGLCDCALLTVARTGEPFIVTVSGVDGADCKCHKVGGCRIGLARAMAPELGKRWGQTVLVENRAGANGRIATESVTRSAPDGYTILMGSSMQVSTDLLPDSTGPVIDPARELIPVIALVAAGNILVSAPQSRPEH